MDSAKLKSLEEILQLQFSNKELLADAVTHASVGGQSSGQPRHYERLEFLGDAVLDLCVAHMLCEHFPEAQEGVLTKMRSKLVNMENLSAIARSLHLSDYIILSHAARNQGAAERPSILADMVEAIIGAVYRDQGFAVALEFVRRLVTPLLSTVTVEDPKSQLQELMHKLGKGAPVYELLATEGVEHEPIFVTAVRIDGEVCGHGRGSTKKSSQREAATAALAKFIEGAS